MQFTRFSDGLPQDGQKIVVLTGGVKIDTCVYRNRDTWDDSVGHFLSGNELRSYNLSTYFWMDYDAYWNTMYNIG
jgi:hypothetical protein